MKEILILGALPQNEERRKLYESMTSVCNGYADRVSSPIDTANFQGSGRERYERAFQKVRNADLIIGEQSEPSTGQGMEIREAANLNKPVLVVARVGSKVSGLVKDCPVVRDILFYDSVRDLETGLSKFLESFR